MNDILKKQNNGHANAVDATTPAMLSRARGAWLGQIIGDALGTTVEFSNAKTIAQKFPDGLRDIIGKGPFDVLPGQVTDDTELALGLARVLANQGFNHDAIARAYVQWRNSKPFDIGITTSVAFPSKTEVEQSSITAELILKRAQVGNGSSNKQANGSLMRISPLAIFGCSYPSTQLAEMVRFDSCLSHPAPACQEACVAFVAAIAAAINGAAAKETFEVAFAAADTFAGREHGVVTALKEARDGEQPVCDGSGIGWVLLALRNAFYQLLHASSFEEGLVKTVMAGGDSDTNGCIAGALLGSVYGEQAIPIRWQTTVLNCHTPRGETYQTNDACELAEKLLKQGFIEAKRFTDVSANTSAGDNVAKPSETKSSKQSNVKTSDSHPIRVDWLPQLNRSGRVGLTFAPGKHAYSKYMGGYWERDLAKDLDRLIENYQANVLVPLIEDSEFENLKISNLVAEAESRGLIVYRLPIPDGGILPDSSSVKQLINLMDAAVDAGQNIIVHCAGGLGRAGTIGGCWLTHLGMPAEKALKTLTEKRSKNCPENSSQKDFIRNYAKEIC